MRAGSREIIVSVDVMGVSGQVLVLIYDEVNAILSQESKGSREKNQSVSFTSEALQACFFANFATVKFNLTLWEALGSSRTLDISTNNRQLLRVSETCLPSGFHQRTTLPSIRYLPSR